MRVIMTALLAASLFFASSVAAGWAQPLRPGYPAGITKARADSSSTALMIGTGAAIMIAVGILASGDSSTVNSLQIGTQPAVVAPVNTITTTTTTTTG